LSSWNRSSLQAIPLVVIVSAVSCGAPNSTIYTKLQRTPMSLWDSWTNYVRTDLGPCPGKSAPNNSNNSGITLIIQNVVGCSLRCGASHSSCFWLSLAELG